MRHLLLALHANAAPCTISHVTAREYFSALESRISREFVGMCDQALREIWCDGFLPEPEIHISRRHRRITGKVWISFGGSRQELWDFHFSRSACRARPVHVERSAFLENQILRIRRFATASASHPI